VIPASELRPLSVGEIVDAAFKLLRRNARTLYTLSLVVMGPLGLLQLLLAGAFGGSIDLGVLLDPNLSPAEAEAALADLTAPYLGLIAGSLLGSLGGLLVTGAASGPAIAAYEGGSPGWKGSLVGALRRFPALLVNAVSVFIASSLGLVVCLAPGVFLFTCWSVSLPALIHERLGPFGAMRRSFQLVIKRFWPTLGTVVLAYLVYYVFSQIVSTAALVTTLVGLAESASYSFFPSVLASVVVGILTYPFIACVLTVLYFDLRIRGEGYDLFRMIEDLDAGPTEALPDNPFENI
jgi:hypothetical protein